MATKGMAIFTHAGEDYTINDPNIADEFSTSESYETGDRCYYQGTLYRFKNSHSGAWAAADAEIVKIGKEIDRAMKEVADSIEEIQKELKPMQFQYIDVSKITTGKYWNSSCEPASSENYGMVPDFHIEAGAYMYDGFSSAFCWHKADADGTISQLTDFGSLVNLSAGNIYISANYVINPMENWKFTNYDFSTLKKTQTIPFGYSDDMLIGGVKDLNHDHMPRQYRNTDSSRGYYWSYPGGKNSTGNNWYAYEAFHVEAGIYFSNLYGLFSYLQPDDGSTYIVLGTKHLGDGLYYITKPGMIYISATTAEAVFADYIYGDETKKEGYIGGTVNSYKNVSNIGEPEKYLVNNAYEPSSGNVSVVGNTYTCNADDCGVNSDGTFETESHLVKIKYNFDFDGEDTNVRLYVQINQTGGGTKYNRLLYTETPGNKAGEFIFDAAAAHVYDNASSFKILIWGNTGAEITMNYLLVYEASGIETAKYYKNRLDQMLLRLSDEIERVDAEAHGKTNTPVMKSPTGEKYGLIIGEGGEILSYPFIPNKFIAMGNSITCGMHDPILGDFGMASTRYENDWVYHVNSAIVGLNPEATYQRIYSSPFEHCETLADARAWIAENESSFTSDIDLVIIEIGDNVNNETKRDVFATSFPELIESIRTNSEHARIMIVGIWFNNQTKQILIDNCEKYGIEFVDISTLHTKANEATEGDTVYYSDGTTGTITAGIATHPGDTGMQKIGEAIVEKLDMN